MLVDQITKVVPGKEAQGCFTIPRDLPNLSPILLAEGVGQLAAWVAMAKAEFRSRPVAGVTGDAKINGAAAAGTTVNLDVELESYDDDGILYNGQAGTAGRSFIELSRCVGPMLPMEDFDDPDAVRARFRLLCGASVPPQDFSDNPAMDPYITLVDHIPGKQLRAQMRVPGTAPFFADHFPRKPVVPGTLLLDAQIHLAVKLAADVVDPSIRMQIRPTRASNVRLRSFVHPSQTIEIGVEVVEARALSASLALTGEGAGQRVSTAHLEIGLWGAS